MSINNKIKITDLKIGYLFSTQAKLIYLDAYMLVSNIEYGHVQNTTGALNKRYGSVQHDGRSKETFGYFTYCNGRFLSKRSLEEFDGYCVFSSIDSNCIGTFNFYL